MVPMDNLIEQANALIEMGELEQAEAVFQGALSRWPDHPQILTGYARAATLQRRWAEALERWQRVQDVLPDNMPARMNQISALTELGELERAEKLCVAAQARWLNELRPFYLHHIVVERQRRMREP